VERHVLGSAAPTVAGGGAAQNLQGPQTNWGKSLESIYSTSSPLKPCCATVIGRNRNLAEGSEVLTTAMVV